MIDIADDIGGVWRTIGGRRVFIKTGKTLQQAMKESGKFKNLGKKVKEKRKKEEMSSPHDVIAYHLRKGEFDKAEEYMKEYGLEDEREEFADGLNREARQYYKDYLDKKDLKNKIGNSIKRLQEEADKRNMLPSELQDKLGIKDSDLKLKDEYTERFENEMQSMQRYLKAEEAKNTISNVRFSTEPFRGTHLKEPKGTGIWAFSTDREGNDLYFTPHAMSYSDAKKWAVGEMNKKGKKVYTLYVRG